MKIRALDSNNDIQLVGNNIAIVKDLKAVGLLCRCRLLFYQGEWQLDTSAGVPYFQDIFIDNVYMPDVEIILRDAILQTDNTDSINEFTMEFDSTGRKLAVEFSATSTFGVTETQTIEVTT